MTGRHAPLPSRLTRVTRAAALFLIACSSRATLAHADDATPAGASTNTALAEALFREGRERMEAGAYAEGCPKLAESQRLDPKIGTLLNLAFCHLKQGRTATAWGEYAEIAADAQRGGRKDYEASARARMRSVEAQLSRVVIVTRPGSRPPPGFTLKLDGAALGSGALGSALPIDPGPHVIEAVAPGRRPARVEVTAEVGPATATVTLPDLAEGPPSTTLATTSAAAVTASSSAPPEPTGGAASTHRSWTAPVIFGGVAVATAAVGTVFGLEAFANNKDATPFCPNGSCSQHGLDLDHTGHVDGTLSTIAFSVAAAAVVTGVVWLFADKPWKTTASAGSGLRSTTLQGSF